MTFVVITVLTQKLPLEGVTAEFVRNTHISQVRLYFWFDIRKVGYLWSGFCFIFPINKFLTSWIAETFHTCTELKLH